MRCNETPSGTTKRLQSFVVIKYFSNFIFKGKKNKKNKFSQNREVKRYIQTNVSEEKIFFTKNNIYRISFSTGYFHWAIHRSHFICTKHVYQLKKT